MKVVPKLGYWNVGYVFYYRLSLRSGIRKKRFEVSKIKKGDLFFETETDHPYIDLLDNYRDDIVEKADAIMNGIFTFYHYHKFNMGEKPDWFHDPFSNKSLNLDTRQKHWTDINEFDLNTGDIKNIWELSRFDWVTDLARAYAITNDTKYLTRLNDLLSDWIIQNPVNSGVNWRCGQETSIRIMKMFWASLIMGQSDQISGVLFDFIIKHLERVAGNINYAKAQDNNHGTSEAAALYVGSVWLLEQAKSIQPETISSLKRFRKKGRHLLEERIDQLVLEDGSFAQKSVNYHRVVMDTISFVLSGMKEFKESPLKRQTNKKLYQLGIWMLQMISNEKGEVPNLGANDGAMFMTLHNNDYRDFRPSLQLYFALLKGVKIWDYQDLYEPLIWCGIELNSLTQFGGVEFPDTRIRDKEFVQIKSGDIILRVLATQDNFRPSQEVMHIDLFYKGKNILIDTGSYSYNSEESAYFKSIEAHNCLQFGDKQPMPEISRFLTGEWVKVRSHEIKKDSINIAWTGAYRDYRNNNHKRTVVVNSEENRVEITDEFESKKDGVPQIIRFHLGEEHQKFISLSCSNEDGIRLDPILKKGWSSLYYMNKSEIEVIEFTSYSKKGSFNTIISLKNNT